MQQQPPQVSDRLCEYAVGLGYDDVPAPVIERTKQLFIDFLACTFGGHEVAESTRPIVGGVKSLVRGATGTCTVIGEPDLYPPQYAALLNGAIAHSMDFDDIHREAVMHPAVTIFPTLLALAEDTGASGRDFLAAVVVGYDVANKIGKAHRTHVHGRGFHPTATTGIFACTAAGARLLGLSLAETKNAFGMNISQAAGALQYEVNGAWDKRIHSGLAAHNAIISLALARHGYVGSTQPLEGKYGYFTLFTAQPVDAGRALDGLGVEFEVMNTAVKPYPTCRCNHSTVDVIVDLVGRNGIGPDDIAAIDVDIGEYSYTIVGDPPERKRLPATVVEAQFSLYFAAAVALRGGCSWADYAFVHDPAVRAMMQRITVRPSREVAQYGTRTAISLRDGTRLEAGAELPKGEPELFLAPAEFDSKLREWAVPVVGAERAERILEGVNALEEMADIAPLIRNLRGRAPRSRRGGAGNRKRGTEPGHGRFLHANQGGGS